MNHFSVEGHLEFRALMSMSRCASLVLFVTKKCNTKLCVRSVSITPEWLNLFIVAEIAVLNVHYMESYEQFGKVLAGLHLFSRLMRVPLSDPRLLNCWSSTPPSRRM